LDAGRRRRILQAATVCAGLLPLAWLAGRAFRGDLGANPIEEVTHATGGWALRLLLAALAVTPARRMLGWNALAPLRRTLGLLAFGYATLHLLTWVGLDQFFDWRAMAEDVGKRRFITVGMATWLCLLPLALTSSRAAARRLGRRWKTLHRLVYVAAGLAIVHYLWLVKADLLPPLAHGAVLAALLAWRIRNRRAASPKGAQRAEGERSRADWPQASEARKG